MNEILSLEALPFMTGVRKNFQSYDLPKFLPFRLGVQPETGLAVQLPHPETKRALEKAYELGSLLSIPLGEGTFGKKRMEELLEPLWELIDPQGKNFLEIGCGSGNPLLEVQKRGGNVFGCEIGPQAEIAAKRTKRPIIRKPFSADLFAERFDCIYLLGVLEHIENPVPFVRDAAKLLRPGGVFYAALQNAAPFFQEADPTLLVHEHWNYFTPESAAAFLRAMGFEDVGCRALPNIGELCFWGKASSSFPSRSVAPSDLETLKASLAEYGKKVRRGLERAKSFFQKAFEDGRSVGLYAGGAHLLPWIPPERQVRFFDGDRAKQGTYYLPGTNPIESPEELLKTPVDLLVICSRTYRRTIGRFLKEDLRLPPTTRVTDIHEVME